MKISLMLKYLKPAKAYKIIAGLVTLVVLTAFSTIAVAQQPVFNKELIFPLQTEHAHGSTIVELPNGDLLAGWFQGNGERWADDVRIMGARKKAGTHKWSTPFVLADVKDFPDINPVLFIDPKGKLWLVWYTVLANQWETSILKYRTSSDFTNMDGAPKWNWQADIHVKPGDKSEYGIQPNDSFVVSVKEQLASYKTYLNSSPATKVDGEKYDQRAARIISKAKGEDMIRKGRLYKGDGQFDTASLGYAYFSRVGWQTRSKPFITASGRIILPLYSDGYSFSLMAITDDLGESWTYSNPLVGGGNIQPAIVQTKNNELVAYMRDGGGAPKRLHVATSKDNGKTWGNVTDSALPNPGSGADVHTLKNGNWVIIYNDTERGRNRLSVSLSEDNGKTWPWTKVIEYSEDPKMEAHYPAIVQGKNGNLYASYSYNEPGGTTVKKSIKHAEFNEAWIKSK